MQFKSSDMKNDLFGFDQSKIVELNKSQQSNDYKIDMSDLLILRTIYDEYQLRDKTKDGYIYLLPSFLVSELPILHIGISQMRKRLKKLQVFGLIEAQTMRQHGTPMFNFIRLGAKFYDVLQSDAGEHS